MAPSTSEPHRIPHLLGGADLRSFGRLAGVLDMSGHATVDHMHALGLVKLAVAQVEHRFFSRGFEGAMVKSRFHREADLLGTPREGSWCSATAMLVLPPTGAG